MKINGHNLLAHHHLIRLRDDSNQKVQQNDNNHNLMSYPEEPDDANHQGALHGHKRIFVINVQNPYWVKWRGNVSDGISVSLKNVHEEWIHFRVITIVKFNS
jgi:hypothetical protein